MTAPAIVWPQCPNWCEVSEAEHLTDDPEDLPNGFLHYRKRTLPNAYAARHPEWAPDLSLAISQPYDGAASRNPWIQLVVNTFLSSAEVRTLAAALIEAADQIDREMS